MLNSVFDPFVRKWCAITGSTNYNLARIFIVFMIASPVASLFAIDVLRLPTTYFTFFSAFLFLGFGIVNGYVILEQIKIIEKAKQETQSEVVALLELMEIASGELYRIPFFVFWVVLMSVTITILDIPGVILTQFFFFSMATHYTILCSHDGGGTKKKLKEGIHKVKGSLSRKLLPAPNPNSG